MAQVFCKTVWLVDDDELSNFVNEAILNSQQFAQFIVTFSSIPEALLSLESAINRRNDLPDIIFLDMESPGLDGWDFLMNFRLLPEEVKEKCSLYMLSSSIDEKDVLRAKQYEEICGFIVKPLTAEELESIKAAGLCHRRETS